jgi:hypothetical protein
MDSPDTATRPPTALTVVLVLVVIETTAEIAFVFARDDYGPGGKAFIALLLALKIVLAASARRLRAGGALGLLVFELVGILVAIGAAWSLGLRFALVACVIAVFVLVLSSLHAFPTPEIR